MEQITSNNYFTDWVTSTYIPNCIVYSTDSATVIIGKNNLTPSEFLRPFGVFTGFNINFSFGEKLTTNIKNFKLNFYDNDKFKKFSFSHITTILENVLFHPNNSPVWDLQQGNISKHNYESVFRKLKSYSFHWYREYEKTVLEALNFNEFEMYQQPFGNIYMCSVKDDIEHLEKLVHKDQVPNLLYEGVYEAKMPSMVIILNDKTDNLPKEQAVKKVELLRHRYSSSFVIGLNVNSHPSADENPLKDIWSKYFHKLDYYGNQQIARKDKPIGSLISLEERELFRTAILKFFNDYIKLFLQNLVEELDYEISNSKRGIRNGFLSMFKKTEKIEYVNLFNIYKLTPIEKKLYILSIIQFFFRDYENAMDNLRILMSDVKSKSTEHYNSLNELSVVCQFLCSVNKKDADIEGVYNSYVKNKNIKNAFRALAIQVKMYEQLHRFQEIPKLMIKSTADLTLPFISPLFFEKVSIYYLISNDYLKKFALYQTLAGISFKNTSLEFKRYTLNCFGNVASLYNKNKTSFVRLKEFINSHIGDICLNVEYFEGALEYYKKCISLSTNKSSDQDQALYLRHFLKSLNSLNPNQDGLTYKEINELSIPEIDNSSLLVIEEQDYQISNLVSNTDLHIATWENFRKYSTVPMVKSYLNLTENDINALKNMDNVLDSKQNFQNLNSKRNFKAYANNKIYVRFTMRNPLNLTLSISSLKLMCTFIGENSDNLEAIEYETKSLLIEKNSSSTVTIYFKPLIPGRVVIKGVEVGLYKIALLKHFFYKKNVSNLYSHRPDRKSIQNKMMKEIYFDIIKDNQEIKVSFPKGIHVQVYKNELFIMPIKIKNSSNIKVKRFCVYFNDSEDDKDNQSSNGILSEYIMKEVDLFKDSETEILVPIVPFRLGEVYLKIIVKLEEESKFKEIEIKRFLVKLNVIPSIKFQFNEEIVNYSQKSIFLNLDANVYIENRVSLSNLKINSITYNKQIKILSEENWKIIENDSYQKMYNKIMIIYHEDTAIVKANTEENNRLKFLDDTIANQHSYISSEFDKILKRRYLIFDWSALNENNKPVNGLYFYELNLRTYSINKTFLKAIFNHSVTVSTKYDLIHDNATIIIINMSFNPKGYKEIPDITSYELFIQDDENEYSWLGLRRFKVNNQSLNENKNLNLTFSCVTDRKGLIEINKLFVSIQSGNKNDKPIVFSCLPITVEIK